MEREERISDESLSFEIIERIGTLRTQATGWSREVNVVSWNGSKPKYDIRDWSEDHTKCSKGITLTGNEVKRIIEWFSKRGLEKLENPQPRTEDA